MSIKGILSALIFVVVFAATPILIQEGLSLSVGNARVIFFLVFAIVGVIVVLRFFWRKRDAKQAKGSIGTAATICRYLGVFMVATGFVLFLGNVGGVMPTLPFAGSILICLGFGFYAGSVAAKKA